MIFHQAALDQKAEAWQRAMGAAPEFAEGAPAGAEISLESGETVDVFEIKVDLLSEKVLQFLATVPKGRFQFEVGIQSTNGATLKAINRENDWEKIKENCRRVHYHQTKGINRYLGIIALNVVKFVMIP